MSDEEIARQSMQSRCPNCGVPLDRMSPKHARHCPYPLWMAERMRGMTAEERHRLEVGIENANIGEYVELPPLPARKTLWQRVLGFMRGWM